MFGTLFGLRQPLRESGPVRLLPEDTEISLTIRLKCDPLAICRPNGISIPSTDRELLRGTRSRQVIGPDACVLAIVAPECDTLAVTRDTRVFVGAGRKSQRFDG